MKQLGGLLIFFGIGSIVLNFMDYEFIVTMWVDNWGTNIGWGIRIALIVVGAILFFVGKPEELEKTERTL